VKAPAARHPRDVPVEQGDRAPVGAKLAGDQVEERGLAGAVGADDEPALAGLDRQVDVGGDAQAAERLRQLPDGQRAQITFRARSSAISAF
jgi:hypothetical protein